MHWRLRQCVPRGLRWRATINPSFARVGLLGLLASSHRVGEGQWAFLSTERTAMVWPPSGRTATHSATEQRMRCGMADSEEPFAVLFHAAGGT